MCFIPSSRVIIQNEQLNISILINNKYINNKYNFNRTDKQLLDKLLCEMFNVNNNK